MNKQVMKNLLKLRSVNNNIKLSAIFCYKTVKSTIDNTPKHAINNDTHGS